MVINHKDISSMTNLQTFWLHWHYFIFFFSSINKIHFISSETRWWLVLTEEKIRGEWDSDLFSGRKHSVVWTQMVSACMQQWACNMQVYACYFHCGDERCCQGRLNFKFRPQEALVRCIIPTHSKDLVIFRFISLEKRSLKIVKGTLNLLWKVLI